MPGFRTVVCSCAIAATLLVGSHSRAEVLPAEQQKLDALDQSLHKAATLYRTKKFIELGKLVEQMETSLGELKETGNNELAPAITGMELRLAAAQRLLKGSLDHAAAGKPVAKKPAMTKPIAKTTVKPKTPPGGVSFVNDIGPLLADRCGNCHISQEKGGFSVASYAALRRGSPTGTVFNPGKGRGSTLVDLLESGDMPRGGGKLSNEDIEMIIKWIDNGAVYDGPDPTAMLASAGGRGGQGMQGGNDVATGNESVSFMRDIAPVLAASCVGCHGGSQGSDNFELDTFARLKRGGRSGDVLSAGNPNRSVLLKMLKGTGKDMAGKQRQRMPARKPALSDDIIAKFETWISEGAKFDGGDPNAEIDYLVRQMKASQMSHEELAVWRLDLAARNWNKGNPGVPVDKIEGEDFVLYGNLTPARLKEIADIVSAERSKVSNVLRLTPGKPLVKGKASLFVFEKRFELTEFARMVANRELPNDTSSFFSYDVVDAFAGMMAPKDDDTTSNFQLQVAESLCGLHVEALSRGVPAWFGVGAGRVYASKVEPRSAMIKHWDEAAGAALSGAKPSFVNARALDGQSVALGYGLVKSMAATSTKYNALMDLLKKGTPFNQALMQVYGMNAEKLAQGWMR